MIGLTCNTAHGSKIVSKGEKEAEGSAEEGGEVKVRRELCSNGPGS